MKFLKHFLFCKYHLLPVIEVVVNEKKNKPPEHLLLQREQCGCVLAHKKVTGWAQCL